MHHEAIWRTTHAQDVWTMNIGWMVKVDWLKAPFAVNLSHSVRTCRNSIAAPATVTTMYFSVVSGAGTLATA